MPPRGIPSGDRYPEAARVAVVCCGDSRTAGSSGDIQKGGYKTLLYTRLFTRLGMAPTFKGATWQYSCSFPQLGYPGLRTDQLLTYIQNESPLYPNSDFFLIDIGANDVSMGFDLDTACANVDAICSQIRIDSPNATIIIATIYDIDGDTALVESYNTKLAAKMAARASDYSATPAVGKTFMYDQYALLGAYQVTDWYNSIHLNQTGYDRAANGWYDQIAALL